MTDPGVARRVRHRVVELVPVADRDPAEYELLRSRLAEVPRERRGRAWREASVLADLAFRKRPRRAFAQLARLRRGERDPADFHRFWADCVRVLDPYTLGPHGYRLSLGVHDQQQLWHGVATLMSGLADIGHQSFVNSGSLLGLVREGAVIAHDDDVDLAVVLHATDAGSAAAEWSALRARLAATGFLDPKFEGRRIHSKVRMPEGPTVDVFPAWTSRGRMYVWPHTWGDVAVEDVLPLGRFVVAGTAVSIPRRPEPLLEANYGRDWRTPDPTFRFDWSAARERFGEFTGAMALTRDASGS